MEKTAENKLKIEKGSRHKTMQKMYTNLTHCFQNLKINTSKKFPTLKACHFILFYSLLTMRSAKKLLFLPQRRFFNKHELLNRSFGVSAVPTFHNLDKQCKQFHPFITLQVIHLILSTEKI
jgi:hypothetical protein